MHVIGAGCRRVAALRCRVRLREVDGDKVPSGTESSGGGITDKKQFVGGLAVGYDVALELMDVDYYPFARISMAT